MFLQNVKWDITKRCFLGCYFCLNVDERRKMSALELPYEEKKKVVDQLAISGVDRIQLLGGEPLYSEGIFDLLDYIGSKGIKVGINTNGVMLSEANIIRILNSNCVEDITISLDGLENLHNKIRDANIFKIILKNLQTIINIKQDKGVKLSIGVNTVLTGENTEDIYALLYTLDEIGVDYWNGLELIQFDKKQNKNIEVFTLDEIIEILKTLGELQNKLSIKIIPKFTFPFIVNYVNATYNLNLQLSEHFCGAGLTFAYIDWSGKFYPCDRVVPSAFNFYSDIYRKLEVHELYLNKTPLKKCMTSELFKSFSFLYADDDIYPYACKGCPYYKKTCYPCMAVIKCLGPDNSCKNCLDLKQRILYDWVKKFKADCNADKFLISEHIIIHSNTSTMYVFDVEFDNIYEIEDMYMKAILHSVYKSVSVTETEIFTEVIYSPNIEVNIFNGYDSFVNAFTNAFIDLQQKKVIKNVSKVLF